MRFRFSSFTFHRFARIDARERMTLSQLAIEQAMQGDVPNDASYSVHYMSTTVPPKVNGLICSIQTCLGKRNGRPRVVRTAEEQAAIEQRRREDKRERARCRRADPVVKAREAEKYRQRRAGNPEVRKRAAEAQRRRRAAHPEFREREAERRRQRRLALRELETQRRLALQELENSLSSASANFPAATPEFECVLLRRCPCGQVLNSSTASQASGWVERREVSVQCGLQEMPPLPLPPETFPSATHGGSIEEGASSDQGGRLSQGFPLLEDGTDSGTTKAVERRQQFRCPLCQYKTPRLDNLRCHRLSHCIEKPYKCEVCPAAYKYLNNYKSHMCMHTGEVPFRCDLCPFSTIYQMSLKLHRRTHSDAKPFACTMCPFKSKNKAYLRTHMGNHRNDKPFKCKVCSFGYGRKWALKVHMQQQHMEA